MDICDSDRQHQTRLQTATGHELAIFLVRTLGQARHNQCRDLPVANAFRTMETTTKDVKEGRRDSHQSQTLEERQAIQHSCLLAISASVGHRGIKNGSGDLV
jgi:hypothetical protein